MSKVDFEAIENAEREGVMALVRNSEKTVKREPRSKAEADRTRNERQARRREALDAIAKRWGYFTWAKYETAMIREQGYRVA